MNQSATSIPAIDAQPGQLAVRCESVTKEFGTGETRTTALERVDLDVNTGAMTLLVGPSGCGKTTLISIIAGLLNPTSGHVSVLGDRLDQFTGSQLVRFRARNIGFVFQQYNLLPALTAVENVAVPLLIAGQRRTAALRAAADELQRVGLANRLHARPNQLSGGQQQRVAIARALIHQPKILVCDEPTAALDAHSGHNVMQLLTEVAVQPDRAVMVVTHDSRVYQFGKRIIHMADGRVERDEWSDSTAVVH
ncbi:MAG: ABC transporter ATP-binding protein [Pirellulales bacterium]